MRILRAYPFIPPLPGGMENHVYKLTLEQRNLGHHVSLIFNQGEAQHRDDMKIARLINLRKINPLPLRDLIFYLAIAYTVFQHKKKYDVIHIHGDWCAFIWGKLIARLTGANVLVGSIHGSLKQGRIWDILYQKICSTYTFIYSTGKNEFNRLKKISDAVVHWQPSGIENYFFNATKNKEKIIDIIHVGSFLPIKNHSFIIEVAERLPDLHFSLLGEGPTRDTVKQTCIQKKISNVTFYGKMDKNKIPDFLQKSKIFLLCSISEGTPTALLEAMACGATIITSNSNDYSDFLESGENAFIIDKFDVKIYENTIRKILSNYETYETIANKNIEISRQFSWSKVSKKITDLMENYCGTKNI